MNNLFATWHQPADIVLGEELDPVELLARAHDSLTGIPELRNALHLVDLALHEALAWFDNGVTTRTVPHAPRGVAGAG